MYARNVPTFVRRRAFTIAPGRPRTGALCSRQLLQLVRHVLRSSTNRPSRAISSSVRKRIVEMLMWIARLIRRPPPSNMPRQFRKLWSRNLCVGITVIVRSQFCTLHRVQRDVDDVAVRAELRHLDPVADADQVVVRELHARDQRQQRVPEDEQDDRHHRAEPAHEEPRRLVGQPRDDEDAGDQVDEDLRRAGRSS
jgi:hypothetical protein